jgi:hypothetical protein
MSNSVEDYSPEGEAMYSYNLIFVEILQKKKTTQIQIKDIPITKKKGNMKFL